jgi:predicted phosphate transport protein (TIGR00153 family)
MMVSTSIIRSHCIQAPRRARGTASLQRYNAAGGDRVAWRLSLFPRDEQFFDLFNTMADEIRQAAVLLEQLLAAEPPDLGKIDLIKDGEHRCDALTHDTIQRLHRTFVTPFDREDLYALATSLDTVMDAIDHVAALVRLYRIERARPGARELAHTVTASAERLEAALDALATKRPVQPHAVEINRLENEADRIYQEAVQTLFDTERDPITIVKWKELFDMLEVVTDCCEDVANVIEGVVVKHG